MRIPYNWLKDYINTKLTPKEIAQKLTLVGHALDKPLYEQEGDTIMDLEDRGNRGDIAGIVGIARDLSAITGEALSLPRGFNPELAEGLNPITNNERFLPKITIESKMVIRWRAVTFKNVKVGPSPDHVQKRLRAYGMEVINSVVDITNYIMIETGMPVHAFDLDKLKSITLRTAKPGESLVTFEGTELKFDENDLLAADGEKPLTLTTAVGGKESGITNATKNILIEAGLYDQPTARRSALRLNVRNETAGRLGKYLHPEYCEIAIARAVELLKEMLNVDPDPVSFDYYPNKYPEITVTVSRERLNLITGEEIDLREASKILEKLGFIPKIGINPKNGIIPVGTGDGKLAVEVPYYRTDVTMEDDIIEEILRIRGYDKIPVYLPNRPAPEKLEFPEMDLEEKAKDILVNLGFTEIVSLQIVDREDIKKAGFWDESKAVELQNSWNEELNVLRYDLASPQLKYLRSYQKQEIETIKIFEVGKTYTKDKNLSGYEKYKEMRKIALTINSDFLTLKSNIISFLSELAIDGAEFEKLEFSLYKNRAAAGIKVNGDLIGKAGEIRNSILANFGIENTVVSHVVFYTEKLLKHVNPKHEIGIETKIENFITQDSTFKVAANVEVDKILKKLESRLDASTKITFVGVFENEELKKENKKNVTFNFKFNPEKASAESEILKSLTFEKG